MIKKSIPFLLFVVMILWNRQSLGQVEDSTAPSNPPRAAQSIPSYENLQNVESYTDLLAPGANVPIPTPQPIGRITSRAVGSMAVRSEFESFVEDAAGQRVSVFGRDLFDEAPTTFAPVDRGPVPADYLVGPGDELLIRVWGKVELQTRVLVDRNGQVFLPKVGTLTVAGLRYDQLESYMQVAIGKLYKGFQLNVTIGRLRSIQIFVLGSARQPGVYTVSSLSTLVNALFDSGGPSATGTMRRIQLRRSNQIVSEFDVYELLRNGDKSHDIQLLPGDVVFIPPVGPQVAILGSVKDPGIYELKSDSSVESILKDVAGLTSLASADRALLERIENHRRRQVDEFALDDAGLHRNLKDGDILRIFPISPRFDNAVTLRGNVAQPGRYLWHEGMRISDLIPARDALMTRDYWNRFNFLASTLPANAENPEELNLAIVNNQLSQNDTNQRNISNLQSSRQRGSSINQPDERFLPTTGNNPPQLREHWDQPRPTPETETHDVMVDVTQASTEINWDYAAIERRDDKDLSTRIIPFNLGNAIDQPSSPDNVVLKTGDIITIFSRKDVPLAQDKHAAFARIGGEVNAPGVYRVEPGETLRKLVEQAGGLTSHAYLYASQLTRVSTRLAQEEEIRISMAQMQRDLAARYASASSLTTASAAEQQAQLNAQQTLVSQLSGVRPTGRIVLDVNPDASAVSDIPDFPLEDGDSFLVPAKLATVQVSGAVYNENAFRYEGKKRVASYLRSAGGPTRQADVKRIFLIRADGTVISRQHHDSLWSSGGFDNLRMLPGDTIIVPTKMKSPSNFMQQLPFLTQILSQTAMTGAVIGTSY